VTSVNKELTSLRLCPHHRLSSAQIPRGLAGALGASVGDGSILLGTGNLLALVREIKPAGLQISTEIILLLMRYARLPQAGARQGLNLKGISNKGPVTGEVVWEGTGML
jgi:hypothetical protein